MRRIVAIGGGEIGRPHEGGGYYPIETTKIDLEIIRLSQKTSPRLLFIPTASGDSSGYIDIVREYFGGLGCEVDTLLLTGNKLESDEIQQKIFSADIVYVGGGNTQKMMEVWRRNGVVESLTEARARGVVLSGLSAGAICWFQFGDSDSQKFSNPNARQITVKGIGLAKGVFCPHYDVEPYRKGSLRVLMKDLTGMVAIASENGTAIEIVGNKYRILSSIQGKIVFRCYWKGDKYVEEPIQESEEYRDLEQLLSIP